MNDYEYKECTKLFPEIIELLKQQKILKRKLNQISRKLKSLHNKYYFLEVITGINASDDLLENNLKLYFKEIGYEKVKMVGKRLRKEDLRIIQPNKILIIETTGINQTNPKDDKTRQITKHLGVRKKKGENVYGLFILHYEKQKEMNKRVKNPFTNEQIKYAQADGYGLITTIELVKAFELKKLNKLTFKEFDNKIHSFGHITF